MSDLKQQLEAMRDRMADQHFKKTGWAPTEGYVLNYQAGFNAAIPIILEMAEALEKIERYGSGVSFEKNLVITSTDDLVTNALNNLKQFVDGGK